MMASRLIRTDCPQLHVPAQYNAPGQSQMSKSLPFSSAASVRPVFRRPLILFSLLLVFVCFATSIAILAARGLSPPISNAVIVIEAENADEGATVTLSGPGFTPMRKQIGHEGRFSPRFTVRAGDYSLRIERDDKILLDRPRVHAGEYQYVIVTIPHPQTQPVGGN
jgi:hypothetical protein